MCTYRKIPSQNCLDFHPLFSFLLEVSMSSHTHTHLILLHLLPAYTPPHNTSCSPPPPLTLHTQTVSPTHSHTYPLTSPSPHNIHTSSTNPHTLHSRPPHCHMCTYLTLLCTSTTATTSCTYWLIFIINTNLFPIFRAGDKYYIFLLRFSAYVLKTVVLREGKAEGEVTFLVAICVPVLWQR